MSADLLPTFGNLTVTDVAVTSSLVCVVLATSTPTAPCPACGTDSDRIHARYRRTLADLPLAGRRFVLRVNAVPLPESLSARIAEMGGGIDDSENHERAKSMTQ